MRHYSRTQPVGYTFHANFYCATCGNDLPDTDPEGNEKHPIFSWETSELVFDNDGVDTYWSCDECGEYANEW